MDAGNIEVVGVSDGGKTIDLNIRPDPYCETDKRAHYQWFNFKLCGVAGKPLTLRLLNAGGASYGPAWEGYQACASHDLQDWYRAPTTYDAASGVVTIRHAAGAADLVHFAFFAPYSLDRHAQLLGRLQGAAAAAAAAGGAAAPVRLRVLGSTIDGRDIDLVQVGPSPSASAPQPLRIWVVARQHPGESMASWFAEGLLERLTDPSDGVARRLLEKAAFYVVPNCCPDGSFRGHLRTNAAGVNLNRTWADPDPATSPESFHVRNEMDRTGVDMFLDVHGDEELPHVFIVGNNGIPAWGPRLEGLQTAFCDAFKRHAPEFQTAKGYPTDVANTANLGIASKQVGQRFDCLAMTLEMPFKDSADLPDARVGWSAGRAKKLGAAALGAILEVSHLLR
ncbi:hypothetical protein HXX76_002275 [Chlamydomonas incerta]|uniref:Peptidase M14 domain-containing protein n=1 Tax=Chlamydomonas incerta TaxID=51695 RepID=A0A835WAS0_CHLIN|nr:hypothetical protein HXX76_002275 [Chlamydomonas incerta]|eukprot:KAG2443936.1 hypothetical protein HXX76_002275 [Chlamydomonas incerta]